MAGAISMSLLSLAVALGANTGALGFGAGPTGRAQPAAVASPSATPIQAPAPLKATAANRPTHENHEKEAVSDE